MNQQPDHEQPLATRPELRAFVAAARDQPIVGTTVTAAQVQQAWQMQRRQRQRRIAGAAIATLAAAAAVIIGVVTPQAHDRERLDTGVATHDPELLDTGRRAHDPERLDTGVAAHDPELLDTGLRQQQRLASAIRIEASAGVDVREPWSIALREDGVYEIEVDPARDGESDRRLAIALGPDPASARSLELLHGHASIELQGGEIVAVRLQTGVAAWVETDGTRTQISVERSKIVAVREDEQAKRPDAASLAREAESLLAAGRRDDAIATLEQLVRRHPKASQSRTALLDLGRLLRSAGQRDRARCAYALYLQRWPDSSLQTEVQTQLDALGKGPACNGLAPR